MSWFSWSKRRRPPADVLDEVVFAAPHFAWTMRDLVAGVLVTGNTGSGKTTGPLRMIVRAAFETGCGAIVFGAKPGEAAGYARLAAACGRAKDVALLDRHAHHRVNLCAALDRPLADPGTRAALVAAGIGVLMEVAGRGGRGHESEPFWRQAADRALRHAVLLLVLAGVPVTPAAITQVLQSLPTGPRAVTADWFKAGACFRAVRAAHARKGEFPAEYQAVRDWALTEMAALSPKTKSVVVAHVTGSLDAASRGVVQRILATDTTLDLAAAIRDGRIVLCDFDYPTWTETARFLYAALKHLVQAAALCRDVTPASRPFLLVADEYQNVVSEHDFLYASMSRSSRCPMVVCTQGHESLHAVFPGDNGRAKVNTLVGNLVSKFYCLPTPTTAAELCEAMGRRKRLLVNASAQAGAYASPLDLLLPSPSRASGGVSEAYESVLFPTELARMRTGGPANGFVVDALLVQSGRVFPGTGYCFTPVAFEQERD